METERSQNLDVSFNVSHLRSISHKRIMRPDRLQLRCVFVSCMSGSKDVFSEWVSLDHNGNLYYSDQERKSVNKIEAR